MKLKNIKNKLFFSLILILSNNLNSGDFYSQSFYSPRPTFQSSMPEKVSFFRPDSLDSTPGPGFEIQFVPYGSKTTSKGSERLAVYFLPETAVNGCINIMETDPFASEQELNLADLNEAKTVEARNLNIETVNQNFKSKVCFSPVQKLAGLGITFRQRLNYDAKGFTKYWFEFSTPIVHVTTNMNLREEIINDGGGVAKNANGSTAIGLDDSPRVANAIQAFNQPNWCYGKIACHDLEKWCLADIELKLGWNHIRTYCCVMNSYIGLVVPSGNTPKAKYLFEPLGGNNNHFGFMFGGGTYYQWWKSGCHSISVNIDTCYRYLFSNHQLRSFDPISKPWGRYQEVYANSQQAQNALEESVVDPTQASRSGTSGINAFTLPTEVTPQFSTDINTAFQYLYEMPDSRYMVEGGFNFWANQAERVRIDDCYLSTAVKGLQGAGEFTLARTIKDNFSGSNYSIEDYTYQPLRTSDLNLESASQPSGLASILYLTAGYQWNRDFPKFIALGGSWEGGANNTIMDRWTAWFKLGILF